MDRAVLVRRAFHLTSPVWLVWYWMPPDAWVGVRKEGVLLFFLSGALLIEAGRLILGKRIPGLRAYESDRLSAYAWGALGLALGELLFPGELVIPTFWGMAWIDPLCAYARQRGGYPYVPAIAYAALWIAVSVLVVPLAAYQTTSLAVLAIAPFAAAATALAIVVEKPNLKHVDDDFLMFVVPLLALAALSAVV